MRRLLYISIRYLIIIRTELCFMPKLPIQDFIENYHCVVIPKGKPYFCYKEIASKHLNPHQCNSLSDITRTWFSVRDMPTTNTTYAKAKAIHRFLCMVFLTDAKDLEF